MTWKVLIKDRETHEWLPLVRRVGRSDEGPTTDALIKFEHKTSADRVVRGLVSAGFEAKHASIEPRYSHQYLVAVTVESTEKDPDWVPEAELFNALAQRTQDIVDHDGREAFSHNDTERV